MNKYKDFIEWMCPQVTVNFTDLGDENLSAPIGQSYRFADLPAGSNVGDFRIGADDPMSNPWTIAHAHYPTQAEPGVIGGVWGDLHFNVDQLFRKDLDTAGTAYSVLYIALHELGHALGLEHPWDRDRDNDWAVDSFTDDHILTVMGYGNYQKSEYTYY